MTATQNKVIDDQKKEFLLFEDIKAAYLDKAKMKRKTNIINKHILKNSKGRTLAEIIQILGNLKY